MPIAFLWTRKTDYEVLLGIAQGARSVLLLIWGGFFSELVKSSYLPRHPQLVLFSSQSCLCGSNIKVFLPYPKKSIRLIHPPPFALSPPGLLSVRRVDSRARSVAAVVEIGAIRRSGRKGAIAGGSVGNLLPSKRAKNAEEERERSKTLVPENWILITILVVRLCPIFSFGNS